MKNAVIALLPLTLIVSGCLAQEQITTEPSAVLPCAWTYVEGDRVITATLRLPHDVVAVKIPNGEFEFRVGDGAEMGEWQNVSALTPEIVRGKFFQAAAKASTFGDLNSTSFAFETMLHRFLSSKEVRTRQLWGATEAKPDMTEEDWKRLFAVHHTAGQAKSDDETVKQIQIFHMSGRGWADVGYHFLIGPDGKIFEGRELKYQGAHVLRHNRESIGINFLGCYDSVECHGPKYPEVSEVTDEMIPSMGELIGALSLHYGIDIDASTVKGHKEFAGVATACPGDRVMAVMNEIRAKATATREMLAAALNAA